MTPDRFVGIFSTIAGMACTFMLCWLHYDKKVKNLEANIKFYQNLLEQYKKKYIRGYPQN